MTGASVDITIPVLNEQRAIEANLSKLARHLAAECPYDWCLTVVDNGSTDLTWSLANSFAAANPRTRVIRLDRPGRGGALKEAWSTSSADVVAYMDVDLSTGLEALRPLLDPIVQGEADISIGTRLDPGSTIQRSVQREIISRIYNVIARSLLRYSVSDAQCGFKAVRADLARDLIPRIADDGWFFDTELLVLGWRDGLRIREVPVRWVEDDDSRVRIVRTALDDLRGIWRLSHAADGRTDRRAGTRSRRPKAFTSRVTREVGQVVNFDSHAIAYEEQVDRSVAFTGRNSVFYARRKVEVLEDITRVRIGPLAELSVLDVGCGTGTTDHLLAPKVRHLAGVDISEEMLAKASGALPEAEYRWYDGEKLPFQDEAFDVVVTICVLHHIAVSNRLKFISEIVRVTRSGGVAVIVEHNPLNPLTRHAVNSCELDEDAVLLQAHQTMSLLRETAEEEPSLCYFLFSPIGGGFGRALDRYLHRLPLGGQYAAWVQRPQTVHT
jgi:ubiquinone/menaquinone biosynthesis C-methylase UbiE/glycosyltransferase involved in cell wall biosynthesis